MPRFLLPFFLLLTIQLTACTSQQATGPADYDVLITGGLVFDGTGAPGIIADVAISGDKIVAIGEIDAARATQVVDARGHVVAPGFINMLSWATESLIRDGRGLSDVLQGVTLEVMGEGTSMGPLTPATRAMAQARVDAGPDPYQISWNTLGEYLQFLEDRGVSPNVASFVGATTVRVNTLGFEDRAPNAGELREMQAQVRRAMEEGALGLGSSLIYAPAFYADTGELIALASVVSEYDGMYISHMRSEGNRLLESVDELIRIAEEGGVAAEIYHLKASGKNNWHKMQAVHDRVEAARARGLSITADMYTYPAGSTGLDAAMPPWVQEGGYAKWVERLKDPNIRARVVAEMRTDPGDWENLFQAAGADGMLFGYFQNPALRKYSGMSLADVAKARGSSPAETAIDLVIEDGTRVGTIYFLMSEDNIRRQLSYPWLSFGSDAGALDPEHARQFGSTHPRAYGNFVRVIGKYVRDEKVLPMADAIRKLTHLPATNLKLEKRGRLAPGYFADVVILDPETVGDHATFTEPHQLATGVTGVFVNGKQVVAGGVHTGALPGRFLKGPGFR